MHTKKPVGIETIYKTKKKRWLTTKFQRETTVEVREQQ